MFARCGAGRTVAHPPGMPTGEMLMTAARFVFLAPVTLLAACGGATDTNALLDTVQMTEQAQLEAIKARDVRGAVRIYRADATMVLPGSAPVKGADAIGAAFEKLIADPNLAVELEQGEGWASESGELAATVATGMLTTTGADGQPATIPVAVQTVWRKTDNDGWKIVSDVVAEVPGGGA